MLRTLKNLFKQDREKFVVPKSVQNVIPIKTIWEDGIFLVGRNKYAKTFKFEDINYAVASREDKEAMFLEYSELLNSLDSGATTKITINNRRLNKADFAQTILIPMADDDLDKYRKIGMKIRNEAKGGMLVASIVGVDMRATMDIDTTGGVGLLEQSISDVFFVTDLPRLLPYRRRNSVPLRYYPDDAERSRFQGFYLP